MGKVLHMAGAAHENLAPIVVDDDWVDNSLLHKNRLLHDHSTCLSLITHYILYSIIALSWPRICLLFYVLCDNVFITLLMCVCRIIIKGYLLTYLLKCYMYLKNRCGSISWKHPLEMKTCLDSS